MKKFFVIVLMLMMVFSAYAAIEDEPQGKVELVLNLEEPPEGAEKIEVGFSSVPVVTFNDSINDPVDTITLTANSETGKFSFTTASGSGLYVYARLQTPDNVKVKFSGSELSGYNDAESASAVPDAGLDWVLSKATDGTGNTDNAPKSFSQTFSGTTSLESNPIFEHRKDGSGKVMDIYCMAIDISSADEDYREIAMSKGVNYWKTTLTVGVETTN